MDKDYIKIKNILVSFTSGLLGSIGVGGGAILTLYLILYIGEEQITAQGINLVFFIPCAVISTAIYSLNGLIDYKSAFISFLGGIPGILFANFLLSYIDKTLIGKIFGIFLLMSGIKSLFK